MKKEQLGVVKNYSLPYSWTWTCTYCETSNSGEFDTCKECGSELWEEELSYAETST